MKEVLTFVEHFLLYKATQEKQIYAIVSQLEFDKATYQDSTVIVRRAEED
jgi:hypothetical protein